MERPAPKQRRDFFPSKRLLAWLCIFILAAATLPLYVISFYNHPYFDDYRFSKDVHAAWLETRSLSAVLQAARKSAQAVRAAWQGTYTGTFLSNIQPGVFSENLYFLTTFFLLTAFLFCFGFFMKAVFADVLGLDRPSAVIFISLGLTLAVQFLPDPAEAFFWFNGGVGNTFIYSVLALSLGLCVKLWRCTSPVKQVLLLLTLVICMVALGGGSYGGGVFGLLLYGLLGALAFVKKTPKRWAYAGLWAVFLACFSYSISAPGNALRSALIAADSSFPKAVLQAFYYGSALAGSFVRLPLLAVTAMMAPCFARAAKASPFRFSRPGLWLAGGLCLYCAQFAPPLYAGVFIGGERTVNTYYQSFLIMWFLMVYYLTGFWLRRAEEGPCGIEVISVLKGRASRAKQVFLFAAAALLLLGCLAYKRPQDAAFGPQNTAGGSAALSLLKGEAQQFHREMQDREALLRDPAQKEITLKPLSSTPKIFMKDLLAPDSAYDVRPVLCAYYGKDAIRIAEEEDR